VVAFAANLTMALESWVFVVGFLVAVVAQALVHILVLDRIPAGRADPYIWVSVLVLLPLVFAAAESLVLRIFFKRKLLRLVPGLLFAFDLCCVGAAGYVTARYVLGSALLQQRVRRIPHGRPFLSPSLPRGSPPTRSPDFGRERRVTSSVLNAAAATQGSFHANRLGSM
jgi:hypothetical protein